MTEDPRLKQQSTCVPNIPATDKGSSSAVPSVSGPRYAYRQTASVSPHIHAELVSLGRASRSPGRFRWSITLGSFWPTGSARARRNACFVFSRSDRFAASSAAIEALAFCGFSRRELTNCGVSGLPVDESTFPTIVQAAFAGQSLSFSSSRPRPTPGTARAPPVSELPPRRQQHTQRGRRLSHFS